MTMQLPLMNVFTLLRAVLKRRRGCKDDDCFAPITTTYSHDGINPGDVDRYNVLLGFRKREIPVTYYYLVAQRAQLSTMLQKQLPFRVIGMIHVENELVEHAPAKFDQALNIITTLQIERRTVTGARYCVLETIAEHNDGKVFTCRSRYLATAGQRLEKLSRGRKEKTSHTLMGSWKLDRSSGRRYASVSGDWNPIHLWKWSARLMGFRSPIIHGMHTVAKACAVLEPNMNRHITAISARFKSPIPLGEEVGIASTPETGMFVVICNGGVAAEGNFAAR